MTLNYILWFGSSFGGGPLSVVVNVLDCDIIISEFKLQSYYYVHFWIKTLGKSENPLILPQLFFLKDGFVFK